ncbi:MBL fold metallo-hydrolase [Parahaliea aestuarii]|uniref:MBL fold metallo-hydrolase n=1 Tax=Parahaliea aestuarii TaxID=1852021 RepID=A0A5C9A1J4_9GAMM|nr:MBL fold metallo-hydrolase [Parahaliea aestuarii]TXS93497.1 MBL fold metallo-hydrolase [Parahaliea aestuarii]
MRQIQADVWETATESPFPGLTTHAYLFRRDRGNVLFYATSIQSELDAMQELGGVSYHFLSHRDEFGVSLSRVRENFGAKLGCHELEKEDCAKYCQPDILFTGREQLLDDVEVVPVPGHSPGSVCFLVTASGKRYLFTGDTIYCAGEGHWRAGYIPGFSTVEDARGMIDSLAVIRGLEPDVVLSSAFSGDTGYQAMSPGDWPGYVDDALAGLRLEIEVA